MRIFLGFLVAGVAVALAVYIHTGLRARTLRVVTSTDAQGNVLATNKRHVRLKQSWQDPVALLIGIAGVGAGIGIVYSAVRKPR